MYSKYHSLFLFLLVSFINFDGVAQDSVSVNPDLFRYSYQYMYETANPNTLRHRIFYKEPSKGPDAAWFDAVKRGNFKLVKDMLEANSRLLEAKDIAALGQTALGWAAFIGYTDMVTFLIEKGADLYAADRGDVLHVLKAAVLGGNIETIAYLFPLFEQAIDLNDQEPAGETLLMIAAADGRLEAVKFLMGKGADIHLVSEKYHWNALTAACKRGHREIVEVLLKAGAVNNKTQTPECGDYAKGK